MRNRRDHMTPAAFMVSLIVHAAVAAALLVEWGGSTPAPLPTVVVELVDGPPGQRNAVLDRTSRNSGVAALPEPPNQPPANPTDAQPTPPEINPTDIISPPDAQRPSDAQPVPEPKPQLQTTLPMTPTPPRATGKPTAKPTPANRQIAARPTEPAKSAPSNDATANAPIGELTPPRFGLGAGQNPMPEYPDYARRRGWEGRVVLTVEVDETGRSRSVAIKQTSGHPVLDDAALAAVRAWRFTPGTRGNAPVAAQIDVPIRFRLEDVR